MTKLFQFFVFGFILFYSQNVFAQTALQGKFFEIDSTTSIEKVNIVNEKTNAFTTTNSKGKFKLENAHIGDSIRFSKIGYHTSYFIINNLEMPITIYLEKNKNQMQSIKVYAKGDIISHILNKVVKYKSQNNPFDEAMEANIYNNITLRLNELDRLKGKANAIRKVINEYRQANPSADTSFIPVFLSEAYSTVYVRQNPKLQKEIIKNTNVKSLGVASDGIINELIGSSFQSANFYNEQVKVLGRNFTSPIANSWKANFKYNYYGIINLDNRDCYKIGFAPNNAKDVNFSGEMLIDTATYSLYKIKVYLDGRANINYVKEFMIEQFFDKPEGYNRFYPVESVMDIGVSLNRKDGLGMQAHLSSSTLNIKSTQPKDIAFYTPATERLENSSIKNDSVWNSYRSANESANTQNTINQISSIENSPTITRMDKTIRLLSTGYAPTKSNYQLGSFYNSVALNNIEGVRFSIGARGRDMLNKKLMMQGYIAYGTYDKQIKGMAEANYILSKKPWINIGAKYENDIRRLGITTLLMNDNSLNGILLSASNHWGKMNKVYHTESYNFNLMHEIAPGITQKLTAISETFDPLYSFQFIERHHPTKPDITASNMKISELDYEFNYNKGEVLVRNNTKRAIKLKQNRDGFQYLFRYSIGKAGDQRAYTFHKFYAEINKKFSLNKYGNGNIRTAFFYTPSTMPYPLLYTIIGNPTILFSKYAFNTMNFFEFTTDKSFKLQYLHDFNGYITNRIPLLKKANLRTHFTGTALWGSIAEHNQNIIPIVDSNGNIIPRAKTLDSNMPFVEAGFGVSNIFKVLRLDLFHRFTYREPKTKPIYFKISVLVGL